jgi:hypothetical protein
LDFETLTNYTNKKYKKLKNNACFSYSVHGFTNLLAADDQRLDCVVALSDGEEALLAGGPAHKEATPHPDLSVSQVFL